MAGMVLRGEGSMKNERPRGRCSGSPGSSRWDWGLLLGVLLGLGLGVELRGVAILDRHAQRLLQELAGLAALGAGVALRLHGGLALRRDRDLDDLGHQGSSSRVISR